MNPATGQYMVMTSDFRLTIKQKEEHVTQVMAGSMQSAPSYQPVLQASQAPSSQGNAPASDKTKGAEPAESNLLTVKSPMIGTFYRRSSPDKPNLTEVGDEIAPGKVVCIIEAMKLFNEIEAEVKGKVVKVLVEDASPVEYDQPLFLVEPA
ncbi:MAG: acetyl-CoA carboxylase biotin carboxyl carrier protein [Chitinophagaceae bacterium]|nr:acetyl-CoA carboxylase biotin carboxyl carrier protein [Chitinophagaceae bacterium]